MLELKGFITNLGKYNEGCLVGKWVTFPIDEDDLEEVLQEIEINEEYEEYFFTDWDCEIDLDLGEYVNIEEVNEIAEQLENYDKYDLDVIRAACEIWSVKEVLENDIYDYNLYSDITSNYDLGYYWIHESGCYDLREFGNLANYFDYEKFGHDIDLESNGGFTSYGYIEYIG